MKAPRETGQILPPQAQFERALALHRRGQLAEAEQGYQTILKSQHRHFDAAHLLGLIFLQRGDWEAAEKQIRRALKFAPTVTTNPNVAEANNNLGLALMKLERLEEALIRFDAAIAIVPSHRDAAGNRGGVFYQLGRLEEALAVYDGLIAGHPQDAVMLRNRGRVLRDLKRLEDARSDLDKAIALQPDFHDAFYNRALVHLAARDFAQGWEDAEHRWQTEEYAEYSEVGQLSVARTREDLRGKTVLLVAEQGIGDEIMFASMIPDLMRDASHVTLECDSRLFGLFARSFPGLGFVERAKPWKWTATDYDLLMSAGSLGRLYRNTRDDFPARDAYLAPSPEIAAKWSERLSAGPQGLKVGISWRGGTQRTRRAGRSIPLASWKPLLELEGVHFVSLQYGPAVDEVRSVNRLLSRPISWFEPSEIDDFDELAGLTAALDLVVTIDNSLVYVTGAIGKTCLVMVPHLPEWRYGVRGDTIPWFPSVRLYRQAEPETWSATIEAIAADLTDPTKQFSAILRQYL